MGIPIAEIRRRYPDPIRLKMKGRYDTSCYCVGGAVCLSHPPLNAVPPAWPSINYLRAGLVEWYGIGRIEAGMLASKVIDLSDDGRFDEAWDALESATTGERRVYP